MKKLFTLFCLLVVFNFVRAQNIIQAEYYFDDNDFGFGQCNAISLAASSDSTWNLLSPGGIPTNGLSMGNHKLYIRTLDDNNQWSQTIRRNVNVVKNDEELYVVNVEYFFSDDLGYEDCFDLALTPSTDSTWTFNIPYSNIPVFGVDTTVYFRVKDSLNYEWSHTVRRHHVITDATGIQENFANNSISIYPNPAIKDATLEFSQDPHQPIFFTLLNVLGEILQQQNIIHRTTQISMNQPAGIYFIKINTAKETVTRKIIIQN